MLPAEDAAELYGREYYVNGFGPVPYERSGHWLNFFAMVADEIIRALNPTRVLDAGCAMGFLVEAFWDRGVYCEGIDISEYAISQARRDIAAYCSVGSISEPIPGKFDLVTCIEVLEHLPPAETRAAVRNLCAISDVIFFSSTPSDFSEPTHVNVRPTIYWLELFSEFSFRPDARFDASFLTPHAMLLKKASPSEGDFLRLFSESVRHKAASQSRADALHAAQTQFKELQTNYEQLLAARQRQTDEFEHLRQESAHAQRELTAVNAGLRKTLEETRAEGDALRSALEKPQSELQKLQSELQKLQSELQKLQSDSQELRSELQRKQIERDLLLASPVWRLSRPILVIWHALPSPLRRGVRAGSQLVWWALKFELPDRIRQRRALRRELQLIDDSELFDAAWYCEEYPDIKASGINPARHYLFNGAAEGRNPGPRFDTKRYLESCPDVVAAGMNPLLHYIQFGATEGRTVHTAASKQSENPSESELDRSADLLADCSLFDGKWYRDQYADVAAESIDPVDHYLSYGAAEGRNPGPDFDGAWYLELYPDVAAAGMNPLVHYLSHGVEEGRETRPVKTGSADPGCDGNAPPTLDRVLEAQFGAFAPLRTFLVPKASPRVNVVTDSINSGWLYGGVGTSLILSALLAQRLEASVRLVTRLHSTEISNFGEVLSANGIAWEGNVEFLHSPPNGQREVPVSEGDVFLTTSWWTTRSVRGVVNPSRVIYLLQEDERMFYPFGDERLRCEETLSDRDICFVVNSEGLFEHLTTGPDALENVRQHGTWFEPAFPWTQYYAPAAEQASKGKRNFFFYARPENLRNLYWRGLEVIGAAIEEGILLPEEWDFYFVGRALDKITLPRNITPIILQDLSWTEYAAFVRRMDLGLCLMDTPHSSYPPLDLAASGAVVVTNRRGLKTSLSRYSENILCAEPTVESLKNEIARGSRLACDDRTRFENYSRNRILRDWRIALGPVIENLTLTIQKRQF